MNPLRSSSLKAMILLALMLPAVARGDEALQFNFNDHPLPAVAVESEPLEFHLHDTAGQAAVDVYPQRASHDPGWPRKPLIERPGDRSQAACPPERYQLNDCARAGHPHEVAWWARCSTNKNYSAAFVGGGTAWILPHAKRCRSCSEGTWGLDYDGLFHPRRVWLGWSSDREQGGLGAYATDGAPEVISRLRPH